MAKTTRRDTRALERLVASAAEHRKTAHELERIRSRRDFLIVACYRRGISLRVIADAAGVHYTRVRQITRDWTAWRRLPA